MRKYNSRHNICFEFTMLHMKFQFSILEVRKNKRALSTPQKKFMLYLGGQTLKSVKILKLCMRLYVLKILIFNNKPHVILSER